MSDTTMSAAEASGRRTKVINKGYEVDDSGVCSGNFFFNHVDGTPILEGNIDQFPDHIKRRLMLHGYMQRTGDSYAGVKGDSALAAERVTSVTQQLIGGEWGADRSGDGSSVGAMWVEALAMLKGWVNEDGSVNFLQAREKIKAVLDSEGGEAKIELVKKSDPIKAKVAEIKAKRAAEALAKAQAAAAANGAGDAQAALDAFA